jgi:hypothetical protein
LEKLKEAVATQKRINGIHVVVMAAWPDDNGGVGTWQ